MTLKKEVDRPSAKAPKINVKIPKEEDILMGKVSSSTKAASSLVEHSKAYYTIACANVLQLQETKQEMDNLLDELESMSEKACDIYSKLKNNLDNAVLVKEALGQVVAAAQSETSGERS